MRKTAGELSLKARGDNTKYDPLEIGYAITDDVVEQLQICGNRHASIFDEDEYFLVMIVASDPLIKNIRRHKYAAFVHMPKPRPQMAVFLYNKVTQKMKRLWSLPDARVMAVISELHYVSKPWQLTKLWCDAFYKGFQYIKTDGEPRFVNTNPSEFYNLIRKQNGIKHLSETEFLDANGKEVVKPGLDDVQSLPSDAFDFSKVSINHIIDTNTAIVDES